MSTESRTRLSRWSTVKKKKKKALGKIIKRIVCSRLQLMRSILPQTLTDAFADSFLELSRVFPP
jgi:hypothetical protein